MGKKEKEHRKKVAKRNLKIKEQQKKFEKFQSERLKQIIEAEKNKGIFENTPSINDIPGLLGPQI